MKGKGSLSGLGLGDAFRAFGRSNLGNLGLFRGLLWTVMIADLGVCYSSKV